MVDYVIITDQTSMRSLDKESNDNITDLDQDEVVFRLFVEITLLLVQQVTMLGSLVRVGTALDIVSTVQVVAL